MRLMLFNYSTNLLAPIPGRNPFYNDCKMQISMSRRGDCYDNAPMESFWGTLKTELTLHRRYQTRQEARQDIQEYIEIFYNRQRKQKKLGYLSPVAYERRFYQLQKAA